VIEEPLVIVHGATRDDLGYGKVLRAFDERYLVEIEVNGHATRFGHFPQVSCKSKPYTNTLICGEEGEREGVPVTSVQLFTVCCSRTSAAYLFSSDMVLMAACAVAGEARFLFMAVVHIPVPILFVRMMTSPACAVLFFHIF
jgi:hypothetical protein